MPGLAIMRDRWDHIQKPTIRLYDVSGRLLPDGVLELKGEVDTCPHP